MKNRSRSFYVCYGDDVIYEIKRRYVLKPSEAWRLAEQVGADHVRVMKVLKLFPFKAHHLDEAEKKELFHQWKTKAERRRKDV